MFLTTSAIAGFKAQPVWPAAWGMCACSHRVSRSLKLHNNELGWFGCNVSLMLV